MKANNAIIYARMSSQHQEKEGFSIPQQVKRCKKYAEEKNLSIVDIFEETESASSKGRVKFEEALSLLAKGKAKNLIVEKSDRLTRNLDDMLLSKGL